MVIEKYTIDLIISHISWLSTFTKADATGILSNEQYDDIEIKLIDNDDHPLFTDTYSNVARTKDIELNINLKCIDEAFWENNDTLRLLANIVDTANMQRDTFEFYLHRSIKPDLVFDTKEINILHNNDADPLVIGAFPFKEGEIRKSELACLAINNGNSNIPFQIIDTFFWQRSSKHTNPFVKWCKVIFDKKDGIENLVLSKEPTINNNPTNPITNNLVKIQGQNSDSDKIRITLKDHSLILYPDIDNSCGTANCETKFDIMEVDTLELNSFRTVVQVNGALNLIEDSRSLGCDTIFKTLSILKNI